MPEAQFAVQKNRGSADNGRAHSENVWKDCPWGQIVAGEIDGVLFFDDFHRQPVTTPTTEAAYGPDYRGFTSTGGTLNAATQDIEGTLQLGSDGDDEGASIQTLGAPFKINRSNGKLWFEARWKVSVITGLLFDFFVGLMEKATLTATVPITATGGTLADKNFVGFHRSGVTGAAAGAAVRAVYKADGVTQVTLDATAGTLVADTYIKTGFIFDPKDNYFRVYINNLEDVGTSLPYKLVTASGTDFPNDILLAPTAAVLNTAGSITDFAKLDWIRAAQLGV